nr:MAG TPA: hypothetical protein [Bacteriophage sp.]
MLQKIAVSGHVAAGQTDLQAAEAAAELMRRVTVGKFQTALIRCLLEVLAEQVQLGA